MKLYTFVAGGYLSDKKNGIQSTHVLGEMISSFDKDSIEFKSIIEWSTDHKTIVVLNAFDSKGVAEAYRKLTSYTHSLGFPIVKFNESKDSLCGALTACGIIVSEVVCTAVQLYRDGYPLEDAISRNNLISSEEAILRILINYKTV